MGLKDKLWSVYCTYILPIRGELQRVTNYFGGLVGLPCRAPVDEDTSDLQLMEKSRWIVRTTLAPEFRADPVIPENFEKIGYILLYSYRRGVRHRKAMRRFFLGE